MNFPEFFIRRPIFAIVLSLLILIAGGISVFRLPLTEYPQVTPTTIVVSATYPGASPEVVASTVAAPLEKEINGVEGMLYLSSQADSAGRLAITITFGEHVDPDQAQVHVQNRVARAVPRLPVEVQNLGIVTEKTSPDMLMVVHLISPNDSYDALYLSNFASLQIRDEIQRLPGVQDALVWGAGDYAMRVWLDPVKLASRNLTVGDVIKAIREQNVQVAAGTLGQSPQASAPFQITIQAPGRLTNTDEFSDIVIRTGANGQLTRLSDIGRVELGAESYAWRSFLNNQEAAAIQIFQDTKTSALTVAASVRAKMKELARDFPSDIEYRIAYDPTIFVRASLSSVVTTLFEAIALVVFVVVLFLQSWRASVIPLAAVPVSIIGTFAVMLLFGFTLNTLSLFGLVLAIGIVVDDAIVVVENVERHLARGLGRMEAAKAAMREVTGPIIATTLVLVAVFVPTAFLSGLSGQFYRQFALTIAISTIISTVNSLTLSPALAAMILRERKDQVLQGKVARIRARIFRPFNGLVNTSTDKYVAGVHRFIRAGVIGAILYLALGALTGWGLFKTPLGFVPAQDKYYLVSIVQLPDGASLDRTEAIVRQVTDLALAEPGVESVAAFPGVSISGFSTLPNAAVLFAMLDPFERRTSEDLSANAIANRLNQKLRGISEGFSAIFPPPPVPGLGAIGGFKLQIQDRSGQGYEALNAAMQNLLAAARARPEFTGLFTSFQINAPQLRLDIDRDKAKVHKLALGDVYQALQVNLGSSYVNDITLFDRSYRVYVQAEAESRQDESALRLLHARNATGQLVPLASVVTADYTTGPDRVIRYNAFPSADINGNAAPGVSSGEAVALMEQLAREHLPTGFGFEWTDLTFQQKQSGSSAIWVFILCVFFAYLVLAAQYNSWSLPLAVILIVPLTLLSALVGVWLTGGDNNLFTQIALIVLVGLASKNAILIVEFAADREREGASPQQAALDACRLRLRPIVMTSLAFIVGVLPLVFASGAGAEMRQAMGIAVFAGMLGVTLFGLFLTPLFYVGIRKFTSGRVQRSVPVVNFDAAEISNHV